MESGGICPTGLVLAEVFGARVQVLEHRCRWDGSRDDVDFFVSSLVHTIRSRWTRRLQAIGWKLVR